MFPSLLEEQEVVKIIRPYKLMINAIHLKDTILDDLAKEGYRLIKMWETDKWLYYGYVTRKQHQHKTVS